MVASDFLLDSRGPRFARLGFQRWIAGIADIEPDGLFEAGFFDSFAVVQTKARFAPETSALQQRHGSSDSWHNARAETSVRFRSAAKTERHSWMRGIAEIEKAALIVAAGVIDLNRREEGVFYFVLVAASCREFREQEACLSGHIGAILFGA